MKKCRTGCTMNKKKNIIVEKNRKINWLLATYKKKILKTRYFIWGVTTYQLPERNTKLRAIEYSFFFCFFYYLFIFLRRMADNKRIADRAYIGNYNWNKKIKINGNVVWFENDKNIWERISTFEKWKINSLVARRSKFYE